jgi:hypothetical protein
MCPWRARAAASPRIEFKAEPVRTVGCRGGSTAPTLADAMRSLLRRYFTRNQIAMIVAIKLSPEIVGAR